MTSRRAAVWGVHMKLEDLFVAWHGSCAYCGMKLNLKPDQKEKRVVPTRDHFIPLASGGGKGKRNHVLACKPCNAQKGAFDPRVFVSVWHRLDANGLRSFVENLDEPASKSSFAGRLKALLRPKSRVKRKQN